MTSGIVSALGRTVQVPADNGQTAVLLSAMQTDAAINPGNSGGALTDCSGSLIGVPTANATVTNEAGQSSVGSVGLGFAIPVDLAKAVSDELIATGAVTHSYLGVQVIELPPSTGEESTTAGRALRERRRPWRPGCDRRPAAGRRHHRHRRRRP